MSKESFSCPICNGELSGYDHRLRHVIVADGSKETYRLRRLRCQDCGRRHLELPSFMQPYKQYAAEVVEAVLDEAGTSCPAEESTIRLWRRQLALNHKQIDGALQSLCSVGSLLCPDSLLQSLRKHGPGWLTFVTQKLLHANVGVPTQFAFCP